MAYQVLRKSCAACGAGFDCGPGHESGRCWCDGYPPILPPSPGLECLCPSCLARALAPHIAKLIDSVPKEARRHNPLFTKHATPGVFVEGIDFYKEEHGYTVFTAWYHLKRGECCGNGCRHCPY